MGNSSIPPWTNRLIQWKCNSRTCPKDFGKVRSQWWVNVWCGVDRRKNYKNEGWSNNGLVFWKKKQQELQMVLGSRCFTKKIKYANYFSRRMGCSGTPLLFLYFAWMKFHFFVCCCRVIFCFQTCQRNAYFVRTQSGLVYKATCRCGGHALFLLDFLFCFGALIWFELGQQEQQVVWSARNEIVSNFQNQFDLTALWIAGESLKKAKHCRQSSG